MLNIEAKPTMDQALMANSAKSLGHPPALSQSFLSPLVANIKLSPGRCIIAGYFAGELPPGSQN